jgi:hypothetical protein
MFFDTRNITINGGSFTDIRGDANHYNIQPSEKGMQQSAGVLLVVDD